MVAIFNEAWWYALGMEGMPNFEAAGSAPRYQPEGVSGPEQDQMYRNMLQIKLAERAFPDVDANNRMKAWTDGGDMSFAARFGDWFDNPAHPHVHLDEIEALDRLNDELRGGTTH